MAEYRFLAVDAPQDSLMMEMPFEVRLLFHYLSLIADDFGFLADNPMQIENKLFPRQERLIRVEAGVDLLVAAGRLARFMSYEGTSPRRIISIRNWANYQTPNTYKKPDFGDKSLIESLSRDKDGKTISHRRKEYRKDVERVVIPTYKKVPTPTRMQRKALAERLGATTDEGVLVSCERCQSVHGSIFFVPPFVGDIRSGWYGAYVSEGLEIVPDDTAVDGVAVICRRCREPELVELLDPLGDAAVKNPRAPKGQFSFDQMIGGGVEPEDDAEIDEDVTALDDVVAPVTPIENPAPKKGGRKRDYEFEALCEVCMIDMKQLTPSMRGSINKALKDLRSTMGADLNPEIIRIKAEVFRSRYARMTLTPSALAKHWAQLDPDTPTRQIGGRIGTDFSEWESA